MKLIFIGAAHEVTGSCHYIEAAGKKMIVDCGMQQGPDEYERQEIPISPAEIDYVFLTHAHIDHSGLIPLIYKNGFRGKIFSTTATAELCKIMLRDSAHIQMFEAEWKNRKAKRSGRGEVLPLYDMDDAEGALKHFEPCAYGEKIKVSDGVELRFTDVGHLLGSASAELWLTEDGVSKKIVFSGDIGNTDQPLIKDPDFVDEADYVVMESTYGDRVHKARDNYIEELTEIIQSTFDKGGNVVIPSFAVGRTQELLYYIRKIKADNLIKNHDNFPVYVDSPLAIEATNIYNKNYAGNFDDEAMELINAGINPISFPDLKISLTSDDSKLINFDKNPKIIISASGMCEAGRIKHHLKHNLWRYESTVLFVGYQAVGTLGRSILEGADAVKLFGEEVQVNARIERLEGISAHADRDGLVRWLRAIKNKPAKVFVVHGDSAVCELFSDMLERDFGYDSYPPYSGTEFDLKTGIMLNPGAPVLKAKVADDGRKQLSRAFTQLIAAGKRLTAVIMRNEGGANKDLAKFTSQIEALCDKWDR